MGRTQLSRLVAAILATMMICGMGSAGNAALLSVDDPVFGPDTITRDTATGLDWLDLTESILRSFNDVAGQFGAGGDFEGFRYAIKTEITSLFFSSAGITPGAQTPPEPSLIALQELVGVTSAEAGSYSLSRGVYDDALSGSSAAGVGEAALTLAPPLLRREYLR